jgi:D-alanyl-D-alanine dipeptidase
MPVAGCNGGSVAGYPNGQLPTGALCPLWGAPGAMLRADAAAAFNRMSRAFAGAFGEPLCVEASYRPYQRQVELYASMPAGYAAVPGTSNHGWGLAVDLCGGIQVDNSPEHMWLLDHAAAYNWFHPAWAMPGGGGPHEPWHWEYAG